jgi:uncharacterized protein
LWSSIVVLQSPKINISQMKFKSYLFILSFILVLSLFNIYILAPQLLILFPLDSETSVKVVSKMSIMETFIFAVILGPIIETFVFIFIPIKVLENKVNIWIICLLSTILFSLSHFYSLNYIFFSFFVGLYLFVLFVCFQKRFSCNIALLAVSIIHLSNNLHKFWIS